MPRTVSGGGGWERDIGTGKREESKAVDFIAYRITYRRKEWETRLLILAFFPSHTSTHIASKSIRICFYDDTTISSLSSQTPNSPCLFLLFSHSTLRRLLLRCIQWFGTKYQDACLLSLESLSVSYSWKKRQDRYPLYFRLSFLSSWVPCSWSAITWNPKRKHFHGKIWTRAAYMCSVFSQTTRGEKERLCCCGAVKCQEFHRTTRILSSCSCVGRESLIKHTICYGKFNKGVTEWQLNAAAVPSQWVLSPNSRFSRRDNSSSLFRCLCVCSMCSVSSCLSVLQLTAGRDKKNQSSFSSPSSLILIVNLCRCLSFSLIQTTRCLLSPHKFMLSLTAIYDLEEGRRLVFDPITITCYISSCTRDHSTFLLPLSPQIAASSIVTVISVWSRQHSGLNVSPMTLFSNSSSTLLQSVVMWHGSGITGRRVAHSYG